MWLLTRDTNFQETVGGVVYPSASYPYQNVSNTFGPLQEYDGALLDACMKRLATQSGVERVYSEEYGLDWADIHTQHRGWIMSNLPRMVKDCLMHDDRVKNVDVKILKIESDYIQLRVTINGTSSGEIIV